MFFWELLLLTVFALGFMILFYLYESTTRREDPIEYCCGIYREYKKSRNLFRKTRLEKKYLSLLTELYSYIKDSNLSEEDFKRCVENRSLDSSCTLAISRGYRRDFSSAQIRKGCVVTLIVTLLSFAVLGCGMRYGGFGTTASDESPISSQSEEREKNGSSINDGGIYVFYK